MSGQADLPFGDAAERGDVPGAIHEAITPLGQHARDDFAEPTAGARHERHTILFRHLCILSNLARSFGLTSGSIFKCT